MAESRDAYVVDAPPLTAMVRGFVSQWERDRPQQGGRFAARGTRAELTPVGALAWLVQETGIPIDTLTNIKRGVNKTTSLDNADALVAALGCPQAFHDGTLTVRARYERPVGPSAAARRRTVTGAAAQARKRT